MVSQSGPILERRYWQIVSSQAHCSDLRRLAARWRTGSAIVERRAWAGATVEFNISRMSFNYAVGPVRLVASGRAWIKLFA
jgi:hypothetical protein